MAQAPGLESLEERSKFGSGGAHFSLIVGEAVRLVIGDGVVILAHVGQHAQQPVTLRLTGWVERTVLDGLQQSSKQPAVLFYEAMKKAASGEPAQLRLEVRRQLPSGQLIPKILQIMRINQAQET